MKKTSLLFVGFLLLSMSSFASDLTEEDITIWGSAATAGVNVWVQTTRPVPVYNLTVALVNPPEGVVLRDNSTKIIPYVPETGFKTVTFRATLKTLSLSREDFVDSLQIVSWSDSLAPTSASFSLNGVPSETIETDEEEVSIQGQTEGTELCDYFRTLPGEENNADWQDSEICNTKIVVNGIGEPYSEDTSSVIFAENDGSFELSYPLKKPGLNRINVTVIDPEKNSENIVLEATYTGDNLVVTPSFDLVPILVGVFALIVVLVVLLALVLAVLKMRNFHMERKSVPKTAKVKEKIKESEEWTEEKKPKKETKKEPKKEPKKEKPTKPTSSGLSAEKKKPKKVEKPKEPEYKKKFKPGSLGYLKGQRDELKEAVDSLEKKKKLTKKEKEELVRKKEEFDTVENKLLKNDDFLLELEERAFKALVDAKEGKSSKVIKKELISEGYSKQEMKKIREFFIKGKE